MAHYKKWLHNAKEDLETSKILFEAGKFRNALYATQQAGEQSLKGYLSFKKQKIVKTHNLLLLLKLACDIDASFQAIYMPCLELNGLDTEYRYPTDEGEEDEENIIYAPSIEPEEVENAIQNATMIFEFVTEKCK